MQAVQIGMPVTAAALGSSTRRSDARPSSFPMTKAASLNHLPDPLVVRAKLHGLSKKYDIPDLQQVSCERFVESVRQAIEMDPNFAQYTCYADDLVYAINIVYGSPQDSDQILKDAIVHLARAFVKWTDDHMNVTQMKNLEQDFQEVFRSVDDFVWDMASINFDRARFACNYCGDDFALVKGWSQRKHACTCTQRGLCGSCGPVSDLQCTSCGLRGACRLIECESRSANGS